ncbi:MAG: hypothetical protein FWH18_09225 [Marinilabiliaceae bacterium]|nr:hypothetical protein [Marinilabiliaceae bacterium]
MRKLCSILVAVVLSAAFVSCGPSAEKIKAVQDAYASLVELINETTEFVDGASAQNLITQEEIDEYNQMVDAVNELGEVDLQKSSNAELDATLASINEMKAEVSQLKSVLFITFVQNAYANLVNLVNETTELVDAASAQNLITQEDIDEYNVMVEAVNQLGEVGLDQVSDSELDSVFGSINEMTAEVSKLNVFLQGALL